MLGLLGDNIAEAVLGKVFNSLLNEDISIRIGEKLALTVRIEPLEKTEDGKTVYKISGRLVK